MHWPLKGCTPLFPDTQGRYGAIRKFDIHTGVDLYCKAEQEIVAIESGIVISIEQFTGEHADPPTPWWNNTFAVLIKGRSGVMVYGEVIPVVKVGDQINAGNIIGIISVPVLKKIKTRPTFMLHFELHDHDITKTSSWDLNRKAPLGLLNPEPLLISIVDTVKYFDLKSYINEQRL